MFEEPIKTIAQAKDFFMVMGCSSFHMSRDNPERYDEYKKLNIPKELETEWTHERVDAHYLQIIETKYYSTLWWDHSSMAQLVEELRTSDVLMIMFKATQHIREKVPFEDRVIVSETINGRWDRRFRSGLIYLSDDLQSPTLAKEFATLSLHFAVHIQGKTRDIKRCQDATETCNAIIKELGLSNVV